MSEIHELHRQVGYLQQCLSSDKKPLGLFLGAGCPVSVRTGENGDSPLIPDIAGMTAEIRKRLSEDCVCAPVISVIEQHFVADGASQTNVEDILNHIRSLRVVAGKGKIRDLCADELDKLDDAICGIVQQLADQILPTSQTPYHELAIWVGAATRELPIEVFTTNYDLLMEQAFEACHIPFFDGFAGSRKPFFDLTAMEEDELPSRWARLWKLHGSINWYLDPTQGVLRGSTTDSRLRRVIHPSHLKYDESRRMPYLAMIDRLRAFLKRPLATLIICGYSFRDDHLNEVIIQGLQGNQTAMAFSLMYGEMDRHPKAERLARGRPNLAMLGQNRGVLSGRDVKWPEVAPDQETPDERIGVKWAQVGEEDKGRRKAEFMLGDFCAFGRFLHELIGERRQFAENPSGE